MSTTSDDSADLEQWTGSEVTERLFESSPLGLAYLDRNLRFRRVNEVFTAMTGVTMSEHFGRTPMELLPGINPQQYLAALLAALDGERSEPSVQITGEMPGTPGEIRWWEEIFYGVRAADGLIRGVGLVAVDVTQRKAAEDALRSEQAMAKLILVSAPNGMLLVEKNGAIVAVNPEAERLFGYDAGELVGQPIEVLVPERIRATHPALRDAFFQNPAPRALGQGRDLVGQRKDGSEFPIEIGLGATPGVRDLVTAVVADISERQRIEEERRRILAAERAAANQVARLQIITEAALSQLPVVELLPELLDGVSQVFEGDTATVLLLNEERTHLVMTASHGPARLLHGEESIPVGSGVAGAVALSARPVVVKDLRETVVYGQGLLDAGLRSLIATPLIFEGVVIGVLHVGSRDVSRFSENDLALLQPVADRVALAVERARSFERESTIAETLQRSLLPDRLPELAGVAVAARYLPGTTGMRVGGDWYDVLALPNGKVLLVIGDVMGRGLRAASVMGQLRTALRVYVQLGLPLPEVVARLNHTVLGIGESETATLLLVAVTPTTGDIDLVCAGHLPPAMRNPDGSASLLEADNGIALGVTSDAEYVAARTRLQPGSSVLLYTDGLVERPGVSLTTRLDELTRALANSPGAPEPGCDALVAKFLPKDRLSDDVAMLWLRLEPADVPVLDLTLPDSGEELARVRAALRSWLPEVGADDAEIDDVVLAVCEALSTRPSQSGQEPRRLTVTLAGDQVEAVVHAPKRAPPTEGSARGLGFLVLDAVTDGFGVRHEADTTEVRVVRRLNGRRNQGTLHAETGISERGLVVSSEPESVPVCRRYVRERLAGARPVLIDNAELCVSELVTNAMLHAGSDIEVRVERATDGTRLEVRDHSSAPPLRHSHTATSTTGRGLEMISGVSSAWGVKPLNDGGKAVWCDVTIEDGKDDRDVDQMLAQWSDYDAQRAPKASEDSQVPDPELTSGNVVLRGYPIDVGARARDHVESLIRECVLTNESRSAVPPPLVELAEALRGYVHELAALELRARHGHRQQMTSCDVVVPAEGTSHARMWRQALADLDECAERGELLTPPADREVAAFHRWVMNEIAAQSRGREPRAWAGRRS